MYAEKVMGLDRSCDLALSLYLLVVVKKDVANTGEKEDYLHVEVVQRMMKS